MSDIPTSGTISLNQMHTEVGGTSESTVSINDADIRGLIGKGDEATMSFTEWYGASSSLDTQTITVGQGSYSRFGFSDLSAVGWTGGAITDGTCNFKSGAAYKAIYHSDNTNRAYLFIEGVLTNAGFNTMTVSSITGSDPTVTYTRTDASFTTSSSINISYWIWYGEVEEPFGATTGTQKLVTFN